VEVVIAATAAEAAAVVADAVERLLQRKPGAVLGLATGSSPVPVYEELVRRHASGRLSFAEASAFLLDEYVGLPAGHPESYRAVIERTFTARVDFDAARVFGPDGRADDPIAACAAYEAAIRDAGSVDLQLLGVGSDGHIGFNEPGSSLASRTRLKTLTSQTRADNARFFDSIDEVPRHVLTQGVGTILEARHLVLVADGARKADAVARTVEGPVTAFFPASALQLHPHVSVVVDEAAATALTLADYYREAYAGKPDWQGL
jgi:glucosamine-6-phosphate deaminase